MFLRGRVQLRPPGAAAITRSSRGWVDADIAERAQIDHDRVVGDTRAGEVMTTAADGQVSPGGPRESDCGRHVIRGTGLGYFVVQVCLEPQFLSLVLLPTEQFDTGCPEEGERKQCPY
jgi:hypothetical protein